MRADRKDFAQQTGLHPEGDQIEAVMIAEHIAKPDEKPVLSCDGDGIAPPRPVVAGRLVPYQTCLPARKTEAVCARLPSLRPSEATAAMVESPMTI